MERDFQKMKTSELSRAFLIRVAFPVIVAILLLSLGSSAYAAKGVLVKDGQPAGCIVVPKDTEKGVVLTAAEDLAGYIREMSGAEIPVCRDDEPCTGFRILLGSTTFAPVNPAKVTEEKIGYRGFIIKSVSGGVVIAGEVPSGTANGVYYLAEEVLGVHWYSAEDDGPTCPKQKTIEIPKLNKTVKPELPWRSQYLSFQQGSEAYAKETCPFAKTLNRNRERWWAFNRHWGINAECGHAFFQIVPADLYDTHPEYFPYIDYTFAKDSKKRVYAGPDGTLSAWPWKVGRQKGDNSVQRCLSNPHVLQMAVDYTRRVFDSDPNVRFAALSANDGPWWCRCNGCQAMGPTPAHQNLAFANAVAKANEEKYPNRGYVMLAYWDTLGPPVGMKAHRNVVPMIATLWQCRLHPMSSDCAESAYRRQALKEWQKIAGRTAFYLYNTGGPFTFPGPIGLAEELRYARDAGSIGGFREHQYAPRVNWPMLAWMEIRLMWDVDQNPIKLRNQFIEGYYGKKAAGAIGRVYDVIEANTRTAAGGMAWPEDVDIPQNVDTVADNTDNRTWPEDAGDGLHSIPGDDIFKPIVVKCQADIDAALQVAQTEQEPFKSRIIRDMEMLLGRNKAEF